MRRIFALLPAKLVYDVIGSDAPSGLILSDDDLQEICAALVKANQRRLAEKIADLVASTEDQQ